jgi:hypothetical protein
MLRRFVVAALFAGAAYAAVWPQQIGKNALKSEHGVQVSADRGLWDEFGLEAATRADYGAFQATAYRFKDGTDAFAAKQWLAGSDPNATLAGNFVITCEGRCPPSKELADLPLEGKRHGETPLIWAYMPSHGRVTGSERYALGPVGLKAFAPQIPAAVAAFQFSTEVATAKYKTSKGDEQLILFYFPMPQVARKQVAEVEKLPGALVKRSGSLLAVVLGAPDPAVAESLLAQINYQAQVSWDEQPPPKVTAQSLASMVLTIFQLAGVLILFCLFAGLGFAGIKEARKRLGHQSADGTMIVLHLVDR